jgi:hypothetical protein
LIEESLEEKKKKFGEESVLQYLQTTYQVNNLVPESRGAEKMYDFLI